MGKLPVPFNNPYTYPGHSGIDFPQKRGTPFRASGPGRVTTRSKNLRGGYYVWVHYDAGPLVGYHHMDSHKGVPAVGTRVSEGTLLGYVGSLGQYSTGPHLHSEVSGHRTTDGYWQFFDRNRVVGQAAPAHTNPKPSGTNVPTLEGLIMAEAIVAAPNGIVVHLRPGGKTNFTDPEQYNALRDQVAFLRERGATDIMPLPPLDRVPKVTWDVFEGLCDYIGAPAS